MENQVVNLCRNGGGQFESSTSGQFKSLWGGQYSCDFQT